MTYENRVTAYNIVYEYAGKQYSIQLPNDPGPYLPIRISPSVASAPAVVTAPPVINPPVVVNSAYPVTYPPVYYSPPVYYGPPAISFRWGFGGGWDGYRHHHHHDWR